MKTETASRLIVGDIVRHDPGYGTRAVVTGRGPAIRGCVTIQFRNVYAGDTYSIVLDRDARFDIETD